MPETILFAHGVSAIGWVIVVVSLLSCAVSAAPRHDHREKDEE